MENNAAEFEYLIKKLGKDTLTYVPAKLIPGIITIISVAIFTRIFKPGDYGQYILVFTTATILIAAFSQWVTQSTLRYRAQYTLKDKLFFNKNLLRILLLVSLLICILAFSLYSFRNILGSYQRYYIISFFIVISGVWFNNLLVLYQADLRSSIFSLYTVINAVIKFLLALCLVFLVSRDIIFLLWGICLAFSITIIPMMITFKYNKEKREQLKDNSRNVKEHFFPFLKQFFIYGFPMIGWFLGAQLLSISDRYLLQIFRNSEEVGIYASNYNLVASAISFVSMPLLTAAHPLLMKAGAAVSTKKREVQKLITIFSRYFLIVALPVMMYVLVLSKELADIFLGAAYREGNVVLPIVLCGLLAWYFAMFGHKGLELREKTNKMFMYVMICTATKILLNVFFIPQYGYIAAAVATLICFLIYPILVYLGTRSDIKWEIPWISFLRVVVVSIALAIIFLAMKRIFTFSSFQFLIASTIITVIIYPICLYFIGEFKPYEVNYLHTFFKKKK